MKTPEELKTIKEEFENLKNALSELTEDELNQVSGGVGINRMENVELHEKE